ncbi:acyltransferase family protein [Nakamurella deserti]|uniref:acyltransferase family protein n=1 Tax=Nakamurella deserti TaxID=2164074 RepID=UPI000DBE8256|nr:acyltransferase [Nakamurella deserti]
MPVPAGTPRPARSSRDPYADFLRSFSLLVVIVWHWCFTILIWDDNGPNATSPLGFTSGLWIFTWLLQVLPVFFYIGAYVHLKAWERSEARGERVWHFALRQARSLAIPAAALLLTWVVLGIVVGNVFDLTWMTRGVLLVISPLWFVAAYLALICLLPITVWLHRRYDALVLVFLGGFAIIVDILRFRYGIEGVEWANMLFVWGFAFQLGYFHSRITGLDNAPRYRDGRLEWDFQSRQSRQRARLFTFTGLFALVGLVFSGLYPGSMVGVPGQGSNMAPPTVCIIALTVFQVGVAELLRPAVLRVLGRGKLFARFVGVLTRFALPLFLFHTTGMALSRAVEWTIFGTESEATVPDLSWWLLRPVSVVGPLLATLPVIYFFGRKYQSTPVTVTPRHPVRDDEVGDGGDELLPPPRRPARRR